MKKLDWKFGTKEFWKGFGTAALICVGICFAWQSAMVQSALWYIMPFEVGITGSAKVNLMKEYLGTYYVDGVDEDTMDEYMYAGLASSVEDKYTYYLTADAVREHLEKSNGYFVGIGISILETEDGEVEVVFVVEDNAADIAGLQVGDILKTIDDIVVDDIAFEDVTSYIEGEKGDVVVIGIYRPAEDAYYTFDVVRQEVVTQSVYYTMLDDAMGYIHITGFKDNTYTQFKEALEDLESQEMGGLILDLRDNPGGLVNTVHQIGDELLPEGLMVYTEDANGKREERICDDEYLDIPFVLLVNENSASSSEILSGAVQDTGRGAVVGTQTFGKGLVQQLFYLPDGSGINITIQKYYTPSGTSIHGVGITPDYIVELPEPVETEDGLVIEDTQIKKAVEVLYEEMTE